MLEGSFHPIWLCRYEELEKSRREEKSEEEKRRVLSVSLITVVVGNQSVHRQV